MANALSGLKAGREKHRTEARRPQVALSEAPSRGWIEPSGEDPTASQSLDREDRDHRAKDAVDKDGIKKVGDGGGHRKIRCYFYGRSEHGRGKPFGHHARINAPTLASGTILVRQRGTLAMRTTKVAPIT